MNCRAIPAPRAGALQTALPSGWAGGPGSSRTERGVRSFPRTGGGPPVAELLGRVRERGQRDVESEFPQASKICCDCGRWSYPTLESEYATSCTLVDDTVASARSSPAISAKSELRFDKLSFRFIGAFTSNTWRALRYGLYGNWSISAITRSAGAVADRECVLVLTTSWTAVEPQGMSTPQGPKDGTAPPAARHLEKTAVSRGVVSSLDTEDGVLG